MFNGDTAGGRTHFDGADTQVRDKLQQRQQPRTVTVVVMMVITDGFK